MSFTSSPGFAAHTLRALSTPTPNTSASVCRHDQPDTTHQKERGREAGKKMLWVSRLQRLEACQKQAALGLAVWWRDTQRSR